MIKDINFKALLKRGWREFRYFLSNPVPLSFSKINTYQTCPYKYKVIYVDGHPGKPSPYLAFGTVMHDTLFEFESIRPENRGYEDLERLFKKNWDVEIESYRRKWGKSLYELAADSKNTSADDLEREAYEKGVLILKNYWKTSLGNPNKVRYVEKGVFAELFKYHITGRLDRVDQYPNGSYEIIDYKTGERIYDQTTLKDASRGYGLQAGLYYEMCKESWRDRVDRFVFRYLQKKQSFLDYLMGRWSDAVAAAARSALVSGASSAKPPPARALFAAISGSLCKSLREKLAEKLLLKIVADGEEDRIRQEIRKIGMEEEEEILKQVSAADRPRARLFLKTINKAIEARIKEEIDRATHDPSIAARYELEWRKPLLGVVGQVSDAVLESAVGRFLAAAESEYLSRAAKFRWPEIPPKDRERIAREILDVIYHRDLKEYCERHLKELDADALVQRVSKIMEGVPEIRPAKRVEAVRYVVDRLRESFPRHLDVYPIEEMSRILSETAPENFLTAEYTAATRKLLDAMAITAKVGDTTAGRNLSAAAVAQARKKILVRPLFEAFIPILREIVQGVVEDLKASLSDDLNPDQRRRFSRILNALGDPLFIQLAAKKTSTAMTRAVFHEAYYKVGVVPIVKHVTDLFERSNVIKVCAMVSPTLPESSRAATAQRLVEKLNWGDAETLVEEALGAAYSAYGDHLHSLISPKVQSVLGTISSPDYVETLLDEAAGLFERRLHRVVAEDVEVPYTKEMRENIHRVLDEAQENIRRKHFEPSKGALCGWCEYQMGCPAWCKYRAICKDTCKDVYHCTKWFNERTGKLVEGRPAHMSFEEYQRRVNEKFITTDRSVFRLSFSKMNTYDLCPMNYRKLYLDQNPPKPKSFFSIGLSYHSTMEDLFGYEGPKKQPSLEEMKKIFDQKWVSAGYRSPEEEDFYYRRGLRMCEDYYAKFIDKKYRPAFAREDYFEFKVGRTLLNGFIDRVDKNQDGSYVVIDYKTNPKLYTQEELDEDQQMTMYYLAAREGKLESAGNKPVEPKKFIFQFVNFCKELVTYRKPEDLDVFVARVGHCTNEMEWRQLTYKDSGHDPRVGMLLFPPQDNKYCQSCDHHHICPIKSDVTVNDEIEKKGIHFEDFVLDPESLWEPADRKSTVDSA